MEDKEQALEEAVVYPTINIKDDREEKEEGDKEDEEEESEEEKDVFTHRYEVSLGRILGQNHSEIPKMVFGSFFSLLNGLTLPIFSVIFGQLFNSIYEGGSVLQERINIMALSFLGLAILAFLLSYGSSVLWSLAASRTATEIRKRYYIALLHQEIAFYDKHSSGVLSSSLSAEIASIETGIGEKLGQGLGYITQMLGGVVIAFVFGWKMTLVMMAASPLMIAAGALQSYLLTSSSGKKVYNQANEIASESLGGIRTIYSFVSEELITEKYALLLKKCLKTNAKKSHIISAGTGFSFFFMFAIYSLGFWYGGKLIADGEMIPGNVLTVFFSIVIGAMAIGQATQLNPDISRAKAAASSIFAVIDRVPKIQTNEGTGKRLENLAGKIEFRDVSFNYPSRPSTKVLKSMYLTINPGQTVAFVGPSGSGKSTVIQLLERFYDPNKGKVLVDDIDISEMDLRWYRKNVGLVSQEPILFAGTITENILFGKNDATMDEVENAAKMANAYDFIMQQPDAFNTIVGEKGLQLSGGQKQRIAIARAILKDPKILLLDEATSALDSESESLVQNALDKLMKGRTTIIIAHRLTTIRNADTIYVVMGGKIVEEGNHDTLVNKNGVYFNLVSRQIRKSMEPPKKKPEKKEKRKKKKRSPKKGKEHDPQEIPMTSTFLSASKRFLEI